MGPTANRAQTCLVFIFLLLPDAVPELVAWPLSLTSKRWQALSESSGCWPCIPWLSTHSSRDQLSQGMLCGRGAATLLLWALQPVGPALPWGGWLLCRLAHGCR